MSEEHNGYQFKGDDRAGGGFKFDWTVSIGQVGTFLMLLLSVVIAYEKLDARTSNNETGMGEVKKSVSQLNETLVETNLVVRELRVTVQMEGTRTRLENKQDR